MLKACTNCGIYKPLLEFTKTSKNSDTLRHKCKECVKKYNAAYHKSKSSDESFKSKARERSRLWRTNDPIKAKQSAINSYKNNKERVKRYSKKYYEENSENIKNRSRKWRLLNIERCRINKNNYRLINPENHRSSNRLRKAKLAKGNLTVGLTNKLILLQKNKCACCKLPLGKDFHLDHIIPLALGGTNTDDNIQLLRAECNLRKGAKHPVEFMQQKGYLL